MIWMMKTMKNIELTKEQNECVNYRAGDLLVKGVPGSGKSYIILKRALKIYKDNKGQASIKIFTYTNALVRYTDELLQAKLGESAISVSTVDSYFRDLYRAMTRRSFYCNDKKCREIVEKTLGKHARRSKKSHRFYNVDQDFWLEEFLWIQEKCLLTEDDYIQTSRRGRGSQVKMMTEADKKKAWSIYQLFCQKMREAHCNTWPELYLYINEHVSQIPESYKVDYVFVDEAQDMTLGKMRALKAITKKAITIAADMNQKIYKTSFTWKETGIDIQGRASKSLTRTFRSTKQIVTLAEDLAKINRKNDSLKDELTEMVLPEAEGPLPRLFIFSSMLKEETYLCDLAKRLLEQRMDKTIGVICKTKKYYYRIRAQFNSKRIPYQEVFRDGKYIPDWRLLEPGIKLVVAKSSKGLEFDTVIIPDLDEGTYPFIPMRIDSDQVDEFIATERNLLYVAMTRARGSLFMLCTSAHKSRFITELSEDHYERYTL